MATTDGERREIAERLREYAGEDEFKATCILHDALMGAGCGSETGDADCDGCFSDVMWRLADLIEPETYTDFKVEALHGTGDGWPPSISASIGGEVMNGTWGTRTYALERTCRIVPMDASGNPPYNTGNGTLNMISDGCSECGYPMDTAYNGAPAYCPNCGAKVVEP